MKVVGPLSCRWSKIQEEKSSEENETNLCISLSVLTLQDYETSTTGLVSSRTWLWTSGCLGSV